MALPTADEVKATAELNRHADALDKLTAAYMALCDTCASTSLILDMLSVIEVAREELDLSDE